MTQDSAEVILGCSNLDCKWQGRALKTPYPEYICPKCKSQCHWREAYSQDSAEGTKEIWIITGTVCIDCGSTTHVRVLDHAPTIQEARDMNRSFCCTVCVVKTEVNAEQTKAEEIKTVDGVAL